MDTRKTLTKFLDWYGWNTPQDKQNIDKTINDYFEYLESFPVDKPVIQKTADEVAELQNDLEHELIMRKNFYKWLGIIIKKFGGEVHLTDNEIREFIGENYEVEIMEDFDNGRTLVINRRFSK